MCEINGKTCVKRVFHNDVHKPSFSQYMLRGTKINYKFERIELNLSLHKVYIQMKLPQIRSQKLISPE